jgi:hypothetical protein
MSYKLKWKNEGVIASFTGEFDFRSNLDAAHDIYSDNKVCDIKYVIWDLRELTGVDITDADLARLAALDKIGSKILGEIKFAIIAENPAVIECCKTYMDCLRILGTDWKLLMTHHGKEATLWATILGSEVEGQGCESKKRRSPLTLCSQCKKVRDGNGDWIHIGSYLERCTGKPTSHGYCDQCFLAVIRNEEE